MNFSRCIATFFLLLLLSCKCLAQAAFVEVEPEVGEWRHNLCTLDVSSHYRARCNAAGGVYENSLCIGANNDSFELLGPIEQAQAFAQYAYPSCSANPPEFSGWGQPTFDNACGNGTGPKFKFGVESSNTGNVEFKRDTGAYCSMLGTTRGREVTCPDGSTQQGTGDSARCIRQCEVGQIVENNQCVNPPTTKTSTCTNRAGQPCQISTGAKFRNEVDFQTGSLSYVRNYHSLYLIDSGLGAGWHTEYFKRLDVGAETLNILEGDGRGEA